MDQWLRLSAALTGEFAQALAQGRQALRNIFDTLGNWNGDIGVFQPLYDAADTIARGGHRSELVDESEFYVNVPDPLRIITF